ncbi:hypothetical protein FQZ97_495040 [compost metagenome]
MLQLPAGRRHRHGAGAGLRRGELEQGIRRLRAQARPEHPAPGALAGLHGAGALRCAGSSPPRGSAPQPACHSPQAGGAARRAWLYGHVRLGTGVLPLRRELRGHPQAQLHPSEDRGAFHRGLQHPPDHPRGTGVAGDPQAPAGLRGTGGEFERGVGAGAGRDQRPLRRRPDHGGPPRHHQARLQGDRLPAGQVHHLHGQVAL